MYKKALVEREIRDGARLLDELNRRGFDVTACFWYDLPDSPRWTLVIAAKIVDHEGTRGGYGILNEVRDELGLPNSCKFDVTLLSPSSSTFQAILEHVATR